MNPFWSNFEWNVYHSIASAEKLAQNQTASVVPWPSEFYYATFVTCRAQRSQQRFALVDAREELASSVGVASEQETKMTP